MTKLGYGKRLLRNIAEIQRGSFHAIIKPSGISRRALRYPSGMAVFVAPAADEPKHGGHQQNAHRQGAGDAHGLQPLGHGLHHLALQPQAHGVVHARTGQHGDDGDDQIGHGRALAHPGHDLGIEGRKHRREEIGGVDIKAQGAAQKIYHPRRRPADDAQNEPPAVDIEEDAEAQASHEHRDGLGPGGPAHRRRGGLPVEPSRQPPGSRRAQGDGEGDEDHLHDAEDAGVGVAVDDIPHGVGDEQPRHQQHQGADDGGVRPGQPPQSRRRVGRQGHQAGGQDGAEEGVCLPLVHKAGHDAGDEADEPRPQAVRQAAAEHQAKPQPHQHRPQIVEPCRVGPAGGQGLLQPGHGLIHLGLFRADAAAEGIELLHLLQVVAVEADAPHDHQRLAVGRLQAHGHAVGDGEHLALHAVGPQDAVDALLHPKGLRPGHGQMVAHGGRQVGEQIVIHTHLL